MLVWYGVCFKAAISGCKTDMQAIRMLNWCLDY